jgi:hypothetical protein
MSKVNLKEKAKMRRRNRCHRLGSISPHIPYRQRNTVRSKISRSVHEVKSGLLSWY